MSLHVTKWRELNYTDPGLRCQQFTGINFRECTKDVLLKFVERGIVWLRRLQFSKRFSQGADEQRVVTLSSHDTGIMPEVRDMFDTVRSVVAKYFFGVGCRCLPRQRFLKCLPECLAKIQGDATKLQRWWRRLDSNQRPTDYENTSGTCGVLKVFYFIRFFRRLQGS